jgi:hypothetical protein
MKPFIAVLGILLMSTTLNSDEVFRIEVGKDYRHYNQSDLQRRVWELERAVWQLQTKVYQLETSKPQAQADTWLCTITAMGNTYTGTGPSKVMATAKVVETCKASRGGDGFFCKDPKCEQ